MTTALYRRYRPESFVEVIGQDHVTMPLRRALDNGRVGHAYLFSGPRGCGKTTSARILARCLNCAQGPTSTPCGSCESCLALARGGSGAVDVVEIDAASHGGVDDARDLRERASYGPAQSRYRIYIIDEAHMVTTQGFNALLKIVEEPPEHVKFVFATTEPDKVIGTIRSRTHHYPFRLVAPGTLQSYLEWICEQEKVDVEPGVLSFVVRAGEGSVRDALSVLDQLIAGADQDRLTYEGASALLGFTDGELLDATIDAIAAGDAAAVFRAVDKVIESGHDPRRFVEDILERLRDLIVVAAVPDGASTVLRGLPQDQLSRMRVQAAAFGPGTLTRAADTVNAGLTEMTGASAPRLQLELICARVLLPGASGESGYAARLDRVERRLDMAGPVRGSTATGGTPVAAGGTPAAAGGTPAAAGGTPAASPPATPPPAAAGPSAAAGVLGTVPEPAADPGLPPVPAAGDPNVAVAASRPAPASSAIETDVVRRAWPGVLSRLASSSRVTWALLSQHAQVVDYDGTRLLLGIGTAGLAETFRRGSHADNVRQALIEEIGLDVQVEGRLLAGGAESSAQSSAGTSGVARASGSVPALAAGPGGAARPPVPPAESPAPPADWDERRAAPSPPRAGGEDPAPLSDNSGQRIGAEEEDASDGEDVPDGAEVGLPVIQTVLGGTVIEEYDQ